MINRHKVWKRDCAALRAQRDAESEISRQRLEETLADIKANPEKWRKWLEESKEKQNGQNDGS